jgi:hypothetical protein
LPVVMKYSAAVGHLQAEVSFCLDFSTSFKMRKPTQVVEVSLG